MKIAVTVILYNPKEDQIENLKTYCKFFDRVYAIDNSDNGFVLPSEISQSERMQYRRFGDNFGIAYGLKTACELANSDGFDLLLTMDQDSKFPVGEYENIKNDIEGLNLSEVGIVCLNTTEFESQFKDKPEIFVVDTWITSGNFIVLKNYFKTEGFDENLFIDLVDFDLCHKFKLKGFKIVLLTKIFITHKIGEPVVKRIIFKRIYSSNHTLVRYYYIYRNGYYLYHKDKKFFKEIYHNNKKDILRMLLVEKNKKQKLLMIRRGIRDAKKGILGKYNDGKRKTI